MQTRNVLQTLRCAIALFAIVLIAAACGDDAPPEPNAGLPEIDIRYDGGTLHAELAITPDERAIGLGGRDALDDDAGMLFVYDSPRIPSYSMRGMRFPLDFIWIGADKRILQITADVPHEPGAPNEDLQIYSPNEAVMYVLELNAGTAARLPLAPGDALEFEADVAETE